MLLLRSKLYWSCGVGLLSFVSKMSFKLADNKASSHNRINQKHRVSSLFKETLPSTEYIVNRSGKYCCRICPKWPVFDTVLMLQRHREGEKHKRNYEAWDLARVKKALSENERSCVLETATRKRAISEEFPLLKRTRITTEIESRTVDDDEGGVTLESECSCSKTFPDFKTKKETNRKAPFFQPASLPNHKCTFHSQSEHQLVKNGLQRTKKTMSKNKSDKEEIVNNDLKIPSKIQADDNSYRDTCKEKVESNLSCNFPPGNKAADSNKEIARYYLSMKQNGWILDSQGIWIKDENCEFDSDEEPPEFDDKTWS